MDRTQPLESPDVPSPRERRRGPAPTETPTMHPTPDALPLPTVPTRLPDRIGDSLLRRLLRAEATRKVLDRCVRGPLERGVRSDRREREVTVLFTDLRDANGIAALVDPERTHDLLAAYSRTVSRQVGRHGGAEVDFDGAGRMAVFGAAGDDGKERAAVAAARAIVHEVQRFRDGTGRRLPVGVGVATGRAWVGGVEGEDRLIRSAVGSSTTLASSLQRVAHELETPVVLDATTRRRAGAQAGDFLRRPETRIDGRSEPLEVWLLPRSRGDLAYV